MADKGTGSINSIELASFLEEMGMMVRSGISVTEAVSLLAEDAAEQGGALSGTLRGMSSALGSGASLAGAMKEAGIFPSYASEMVEASEYTGKLEDTLFRLSDHYVAEGKMKSALRSAVRYPAILLFMVTAVLAVLVLTVFPAFYGVYEKLTGSISASSFGYINTAFFICKLMLAVLIVLTLCLLACIFKWNQGGQDRIREILSKSASLRRLFETADLYRFSSCFELFISAGSNQDEALARSMDTAETASVRSRLERCRKAMSEGRSFSQAAFDEGLYDRTSGRMLMSAERSGMLDDAMIRISENLRATAEQSASAIADTAEPLLTGILMIFIGLILISIMLPLIGIMNSIG